jgi:hypothetical protein
MAVDTLLRSLKTVQANPTNLKYQTIDTTTTGFQKSLTAPGVLDFLKAMNFHPYPPSSYSSSNKVGVVLKLSMLDPATFFLGISALEQVQQTSPEYANNKALLQFDKDIAKHLALGDSDMNEALKRAAFLSKCPSESITTTTTTTPMSMMSSGGSQVTVELGNITKLSRKFDGDDTLRDVVHWLGAHATILYVNLVEKGEWHLVDRNHPEALPYHNLEQVLDKTLQYIGCWPSGRLAVVPTLPHSSSKTTTTMTTTTNTSSSRGLGAGPLEH